MKEAADLPLANAAESSSDVRKKPNILVVCTDQQRYDSLGCYGNAAAQTPNIDRLARQGAVFERCYTPSPVCAPARASLLLGQFPHVHGLWSNGVTLPSRRPLLGAILKEAGYDCGLVGKFHLSSSFDGRTEPRFDDGFRVFEWASDPGHASPENSYHRWLRKVHPDIWENSFRDVSDAAAYKRVPTEAHYSHWVADRTIDYLRSGRDTTKPFFFVANFHDPHHPFAAPPEYVERFRDADLPQPIPAPVPRDDVPQIHRDLSAGRQGPSGGFASHSPESLREVIVAYYAMVSMVDDEVGRILSALEDTGEADETLVIFTSDHGEMLGDHGQLLKGPLFYEGAVRVPLLLRWPQCVAPTRRISGLVQTMDIFSTCLNAAGVDPPPATQSIDLVGLATGHQMKARPWVLCEYRNSGFPLDPPVYATMIRDSQYKLVFYHDSEKDRPGELYDLCADPSESVNRWRDPGAADVRRELTEKLADAFMATEDRSTSRDAPW